MGCYILIEDQTALRVNNICMDVFHWELSNCIIEAGLGNNKRLVKLTEELDQGIWGRGMIYVEIVDIFKENPQDIQVLIDLLPNVADRCEDFRIDFKDVVLE